MNKIKDVHANVATTANSYGATWNDLICKARGPRISGFFFSWYLRGGVA